MPAKRKRGVDGKEDKEDSPGPTQQPVRKKKKPLQYDPVRFIFVVVFCFVFAVARAWHWYSANQFVLFKFTVTGAWH